ncbi:hypothetical protein MMB17_19715 [Methylobacterium organophilum]|uniref:hypothetical protein n=1 Tax=Methylobacterium organophilum TaxID=410 RepID=UPI001F132412|nr:hypothetical protein [Methylobacterium organophilum]UMY16856.1 hypothetical protein MMB17_19715 [Methylobacterium organophilum]
MKTFIDQKRDLDGHRTRSDYDPVLLGVAHGLARLLPPVEHPGALRGNPARDTGTTRPAPAGNGPNA